MINYGMLCIFQLARCMGPLERMIALLSAATHDLDHPGVNQGFLIATSNPLATLYKVSSPSDCYRLLYSIIIDKAYYYCN